MKDFIKKCKYLFLLFPIIILPLHSMDPNAEETVQILKEYFKQSNTQQSDKNTSSNLNQTIIEAEFLFKQKLLRKNIHIPLIELMQKATVLDKAIKEVDFVTKKNYEKVFLAIYNFSTFLKNHTWELDIETGFNSRKCSSELLDLLNALQQHIEKSLKLLESEEITKMYQINQQNNSFKYQVAAYILPDYFDNVIIAANKITAEILDQFFELFKNIFNELH
jgi:hypothetical protein